MLFIDTQISKRVTMFQTMIVAMAFSFQTSVAREQMLKTLFEMSGHISEIRGVTLFFPLAEPVGTAWRLDGIGYESAPRFVLCCATFNVQTLPSLTD